MGAGAGQSNIGDVGGVDKNGEDTDAACPRRSSLPGIQETACSARDPCPRRSASSDPPANHIARITPNEAFSHSQGHNRTFGDVGSMSALPPESGDRPTQRKWPLSADFVAEVA